MTLSCWTPTTGLPKSVTFSLSSTQDHPLSRSLRDEPTIPPSDGAVEDLYNLPRSAVVMDCKDDGRWSGFEFALSGYGRTVKDQRWKTLKHDFEVHDAHRL